MEAVTICKPYDRILTTKKRMVLLYSPRMSGKTRAIDQIIYIYCNKYPDHDIMVVRANYNSLGDSNYIEILKYAEEIGDKNFYKAYKSPLRIRSKLGNTIYFKGIGGPDLSRTRGFSTSKKLSLIIGDEMQQLKNEASLKQALATFVRSVDDDIDSKIIIAGNPEQPKAHWFNRYCNDHRFSDDFEFIFATYHDIAKFLSPLTLQQIEEERRYNEPLYKQMYLGELDDLEGGAYAQFDRKKHYISWDKFVEETKGQYIKYMLFGGDGAIMADSTGICPLAVMSNGSAYVLERFYYNPKLRGVISPSQLCDLMLKYYDYMEKKYNMMQDFIKSVTYIDSASGDLITQLRYQIKPYHKIMSFTKKHILRNNATVNNCFAKNLVKIVDFGGYHDFKTNYFICTTADTEPLVNQLESVVWKNCKYDPQIPNDYSDALTYGICAYYENPDNLNLPQKQSNYI